MDLNETIKRDGLVNDFLQSVSPLVEQGLADFNAKYPERAGEVGTLLNEKLADLKIQIEHWPEAVIRIYVVCREPVSQGGFKPLQICAIRFEEVKLSMPGSVHLN